MNITWTNKMDDIALILSEVFEASEEDFDIIGTSVSEGEPADIEMAFGTPNELDPCDYCKVEIDAMHGADERVHVDVLVKIDKATSTMDDYFVLIDDD